MTHLKPHLDYFVVVSLDNALEHVCCTDKKLRRSPIFALVVRGTTRGDMCKRLSDDLLWSTNFVIGEEIDQSKKQGS